MHFGHVEAVWVLWDCLDFYMHNNMGIITDNVHEDARVPRYRPKEALN